MNISNMTEAQHKELLERVRKEIFRRSGFNEFGEALYDEVFNNGREKILSSPDDNQFWFPDTGNGSDDGAIHAQHGKYLIDKLLEVCDNKDLRIVMALDPIPQAYDYEALKQFLSILESETMTTTKVSCRSSCTGLCFDGCTTTCTGSCADGCTSCTGTCGHGCTNACTGCAETCGTTCGSVCGSGCSSTAVACTDCTSGCAGCTGCSLECTTACTGCTNACGLTCQSGCSGDCGNSCTNACTIGCLTQCTTNCGGKNSSITSAAKTLYTITYYASGELLATFRYKSGDTYVLPSASIKVSANNISLDSVVGWTKSSDPSNYVAFGTTMTVSTNMSWNLVVKKYDTAENTIECKGIHTYIEKILTTPDTILINNQCNVSIAVFKHNSENDEYTEIHQLPGYDDNWSVKIAGEAITVPFNGIVSSAAIDIDVSAGYYVNIKYYDISSGYNNIDIEAPLRITTTLEEKEVEFNSDTIELDEFLSDERPYYLNSGPYSGVILSNDNSSIEVTTADIAIKDVGEWNLQMNISDILTPTKLGYMGIHRKLVSKIETRVNNTLKYSTEWSEK